MNSAEKESGVGIESWRSQGERDRAGGRFMESTYPEIYMNLWQEMRQMQRGGKRGEWHGESCRVTISLALRRCLGKFGANGDGCRGWGDG